MMTTADVQPGPAVDHRPPADERRGVRPDGRFYCGSMAYDRHHGDGALYGVDPDLSVVVVLDGVTISNRLDWSPDGSRSYYTDTETYRIDVFDYDAAAGLTRRRRFAEIPSDVGRPDGLTVDAQGGVWVAVNGGGAVRRYTSDGHPDEVIEVPARKVTARAFGGPGLDELFITTPREGLAADDDPLAGALFRVVPGVRGEPVREFPG
jgi:sugar lactone lactonase YvrE